MKVGIVGSGIAGLTAAAALRERGVEVTLYDSLPALGLAGHGVAFEMEGRRWVADVPSRMFNPIQWPLLWKLYDRLGIEVEPVKPTQTFQVGDATPYLNLEVAYRPQQAFAKLLTGRGRKLVGEAVRLAKQGVADLEAGLDRGETFGDYLERRRFGLLFQNGFLAPTLSSTVCTCSYEAIRRYPAEILLRTLRGLAEVAAQPSNQPRLFRARGGTQFAAKQLARSITHLRLNSRVAAIRRGSGGVEIDSLCRGQPNSDHFDHVIVATQANTARKLIADLAIGEQEFLQGFHYEPVSVVIHTDSTWMPANRKQWATFNQRLARNPEDPAADHSATCTVWLNQFQRDWELSIPVFQTIQPGNLEEPRNTIASVRLERPVVTPDSYRLWSLLDELHAQPERRLWFCGSYAAEGVPLLETGVRSALEIVNRLSVATV